MNRYYDKDTDLSIIHGKKVAVIGSGPSGLACAQQLARAGHAVVVFEKNARIGGLLRIGIPDFKMEKTLIDRRMAQMQSEGVEFRTNGYIGKNISIKKLINDFDAVGKMRISAFPRHQARHNLFGIRLIRGYVLIRMFSGEFMVCCQEIRSITLIFCFCCIYSQP